jgi:hypothetical protein
LRSSASMLVLESMTPCASDILESSCRMRSPSAAALDQGLTLVHFSAQLERCLWVRVGVL